MQKSGSLKVTGLRPMNTLTGNIPERDAGRLSGHGRIRKVQNTYGHAVGQMARKREVGLAMEQTARKKRRKENGFAQPTSPNYDIEEIEDSMDEEDVLNNSTPHDRRNRQHAASHSPAAEYGPNLYEVKQLPLEHNHLPTNYLGEYGNNPTLRKIERIIDSSGYAKRQEKMAKLGQRKSPRTNGSENPSNDLIETGLFIPGTPSVLKGESVESELHSRHFPKSSKREERSGQGEYTIIRDPSHTPVRIPLGSLEVMATDPPLEPRKKIHRSAGTRDKTKIGKKESERLRRDSGSNSSTEDVLATAPTKLTRKDLHHRNLGELPHEPSSIVQRPKWPIGIGIKYANVGDRSMRGADMFLQIDNSDLTLNLRTKNSDWRKIARLNKIQRIISSKSKGCYKLRLKLPKDCANSANDSSVVDIECMDAEHFRTLLNALARNSSANSEEKDEIHMDRLFKHREQVHADFNDKRRRGSHDQVIDTQTINWTRKRENEQALNKNVAPEITPKPTRKLSRGLRSDSDTGKSKAGSVNQVESDCQDDARPEWPREDRDISRISYNTRAQTAGSKPKFHSHTTISKQIDDEEEKVPFSVYPGLGSKWKRPLVYPSSGKGAVTVDFDDLVRLDEGEFLNDNLIEFYLKRAACDLENRNSAVARKVYWFNTYFFESLNKTSGGRRGINFDSVKKWTRSVDIFAYDYIVVPINEAAHWYVAIICNLPTLKKPHNTPPAEDVHDGTSSHPIGLDATQDEDGDLVAGRQDLFNKFYEPEAQGDTKEDSRTKESSSQLQLNEDHKTLTIQNPEDRNGFDTEMLDNPDATQVDIEEVARSADASLEDSANRQSVVEEQLEEPFDKETGEAQQENEVGDVVVGKNAPRRAYNKKRRVSLRTYDPTEPAIITLDSLGFTHPATNRALKTYLLQEARDKKGEVHFEDTQIKGLTAKGIPLQDNFCDCGLYLLGYIDKFIEDPEQFVTRLLKREFDETQDWPELKPSSMRQQMRELIVGLHKAQEAAKKAKKRSLAKVGDQPSSSVPTTPVQKGQCIPEQTIGLPLPPEKSQRSEKAAEVLPIPDQDGSTLKHTDGDHLKANAAEPERMDIRAPATMREPSKQYGTRSPPTSPSMPTKEVLLIVPDSQESMKLINTSIATDGAGENNYKLRDVPRKIKWISPLKNKDGDRLLSDQKEQIAINTAERRGLRRSSREIISIDDN